MISRAAAAVAMLAMPFVGSHICAQPPKDYKGNCTDAGCHDAFAKRAVLHPPAEPGSCDTCHNQVDRKRHRFRLTLEGGDLCTDCHDEYAGKVEHQPAKEGQCTACHDPHASDTEHLLIAPTVGELCTECHDDFAEDRAFLHGPVATGACTACHNPHASDHAGMLFAEVKGVCVKCHAPLQARMAAKKHKHVPAMEDCTSCHDPHGADNRMNLKLTAPDLCVDCHDDIGEIVEDPAVGHDAVTTGAACVNCHDPHASDVVRLLTKEPMALCLSCHDEELKSGDGKIIAIGPLLKDNPEHHGPISQEDCIGCHQAIHGGDHFRLLLAEYPARFYAPYDEDRYALCFECHEPELARDERTDTLTNFRNGDRNLHHLHVNRKIKGRTCRACHNAHAAKKPKLITESVPFGSWEIPIHYAKTDTGGSCRPGCHKRYRYDRRAPVVNISR